MTGVQTCALPIYRIIPYCIVPAVFIPSVLELSVPLLGRVELSEAKRERDRERELQDVCVDASSGAGDGEAGRDGCAVRPRYLAKLL